MRKRIFEVSAAAALAAGCTYEPLDPESEKEVEASIQELELHGPLLADLFGKSTAIHHEADDSYNDPEKRHDVITDTVVTLRELFEKGRILALYPNEDGKYGPTENEAAHAAAYLGDETEYIALLSEYIDEQYKDFPKKLNTDAHTLLHEGTHLVTEQGHAGALSNITENDGIYVAGLLGVVKGDLPYATGFLYTWYSTAGFSRSMHGNDDDEKKDLYNLIYNGPVSEHNERIEMGWLEYSDLEPIDPDDLAAMREFALERLRYDTTIFTTDRLIADVKDSLKWDSTYFAPSGHKMTDLIDPSELPPMDKVGAIRTADILGISDTDIDEAIDAHYDIFEAEQKERWLRRAEAYQELFGINVHETLAEWKREQQRLERPPTLPRAK